MRHQRGIPREQTRLLPASVEDYVAADHPVRVIDAFVDSLDLRVLEFAHAQPAATGRPPYDPGDLLKLFLYGYLNQVRSTRRLEREAGRNLELLWLLKELKPDFKTLANFRRANGQALGKVCRAFNAFCRGQGLFGAELVAIDGSKFQAVASRKQVWTPKRVAKVQARIAHQIAAYLTALARSEAEAPDSRAPSASQVQAAVAALKAQRQAVAVQAEALKQSAAHQRVAGELEAKLMRMAHGQHAVAYNVQIAVDAKHKLIATHAVTNDGNDHQQLYPMAHGAKQALGIDQLTAVADVGYMNGAQAAHCEQHGITPVVPMQVGAHTRGPYFPKGCFHYDADQDTYQCPAGEVLTHIKTDRRQQVHLYGTRACLSCALKSQCTAANYRTINRAFHASHVEAAAQRAAAQPHLMAARRELAEHPFANLKWLLGLPRFLLRGIQGAGIEMAFAVTAYNLKRVINILGVPALLAQLKAA